MSTLDDDLPGHDDMDDSDDMDFVRDLMDKFQAVEDAGHRLALSKCREVLAHYGVWCKACLEIRFESRWGPAANEAINKTIRDAILYLTERCGATYDAETRTLRMPKE